MFRPPLLTKGYSVEIILESTFPNGHAQSSATNVTQRSQTKPPPTQQTKSLTQHYLTQYYLKIAHKVNTF